MSDASAESNGVEVSVVIPVFDSEGCLEALWDRLRDTLTCRGTFEVLLVDDHSRDHSWSRIRALAAADPRVRGLRLDSNRGQDTALVAGLLATRGRWVVCMDDDLQHDPRDVDSLLGGVQGGLEVCYARFPRVQHAAWKRIGSALNGVVAWALLGKPRGLYLSSFKAVDGAVARRAACRAGPAPYLDGLLLAGTRRRGEVELAHHGRHAGQSHYSLRKSLARAWRVATGARRGPWVALVVAGLALLAAGGSWIAVGAAAVALGLAGSCSPRGFAPPGRALRLGLQECTFDFVDSRSHPEDRA